MQRLSRPHKPARPSTAVSSSLRLLPPRFPPFSGKGARQFDSAAVAPDATPGNERQKCTRGLHNLYKLAGALGEENFLAVSEGRQDRTVPSLRRDSPNPISNSPSLRFQALTPVPLTILKLLLRTSTTACNAGIHQRDRPRGRNQFGPCPRRI
jgi:hypothetical protein